MMDRARRVLGVILAAPSLGCATIINGSTQTVEITSTPPGARALILPEGMELVTPGEADLERRSVHTVLFELEVPN